MLLIGWKEVENESGVLSLFLLYNAIIVTEENKGHIGILAVC